MTALLVASGGGHLKQLHHLLPRLDIGPERVWITFDTALARSLLADEDVHFAPYAHPHDVLGTLRDAAFTARLLRRYRRVDRAVSTGANLAMAALPLAHLLGSRAEYLESTTRSVGPSLTGRMLQKVPGIHLYTQHRRWAGGRWHFAGSVFDGFEAKADRPPLPGVRRLVVTLGANDSFPFERLVRRLVEVIPPEVEVLWQLGSTSAADLEGARAGVPILELETAMAEADAVVAHAGSGSALSALEVGKLPLLIPRRRAHGEHIDDHQELTALDLQGRGLAHAVEADELTWHDIEATTRWSVHRAEYVPPLVLAD